MCVCAAAVANLFRLRFFPFCSAVSPTISLLLQFVHWIIDFVLSCCSIFDVFFFVPLRFRFRLKNRRKNYIHFVRYSLFDAQSRQIFANSVRSIPFFFVLLCISQLVCAVWPAAYYFVASHCVFGLDCGMMKRYIQILSTIIYMMAMH